MRKPEEEEVGDLFVTEELLCLKLLPSDKRASKRIKWFVGGAVTDPAAAIEDISRLVDRTRGRSRVVRGLTLMTNHGKDFDTAKSGLARAVAKAGFRILN